MRLISKAGESLELTPIPTTVRTSSRTRSVRVEVDADVHHDPVSTGALAGSDESALAALDAARSRAPRDERVQARAAELARVFELMATTASARGNDAEALVHLEALASADPGRPGVLGKLIAAHAKQRELSVGP